MKIIQSNIKWIWNVRVGAGVCSSAGDELNTQAERIYPASL